CNTTDPDIVFKYFIDVLQHFAVQNCRAQLCVGKDKVLGLSVCHSFCVLYFVFENVYLYNRVL
uniref:Uncharacterized protein n=1 Tax=Amphimedon queenslandica TaxID=400682 RepID=A0A1X7TVN4_AMPQE